MGLLKKPETRKPLPSRLSAGGGQISAQRPVQAPKAPPCNGRCPSANDVRGFLTVVAQREKLKLELPEALDAAFSLAAGSNPFPGVMGRVCPAPCETVCNRKDKDEPVAIAAAERWIGDWALERRLPLPRLEGAAPKEAKVAVVGAGPAGLSCAYQLARRGYPVTLLEAGPVAGGELRSVPSTKLPAPVLDAEIARILDLGVELKLGQPLDGDASVEVLRGTFAAVCVAVGDAPVGPAATDAWGRTDLPGVFRAGTSTDLAAEAIASGARAATAIDASLSGAALLAPQTLPVIGPERIKKSAYAAQARAVSPALSEEQQQASPGAEIVGRLTEEQLLAETSRCFSCGMCFDCEKCWMFCQNSCFEKVPEGKPGHYYKMLLETCVGCKKCAAVCPSGHLDWV